MFMDKKLKEMRKESKMLDAAIIVGKNGLTDAVIEKIRSELKRKWIVKVKILKTYIEDKDKKRTFAEIAERADAQIVHTLGFTITLTKK